MTFDDAFATGSSIMPQKKNPDVAELTRGKTGRVYGHLIGMLTVMKGLPLTYNSDMQEDKQALFDTVDTIEAVLGVLPPALQSLTFNTERMAAAAAADFSLATDAADLLAKRGVPFREAHEVVGHLVKTCIDSGRNFEDLTVEEWAGGPSGLCRGATAVDCGRERGRAGHPGWHRAEASPGGARGGARAVV